MPWSGQATDRTRCKLGGGVVGSQQADGCPVWDLDMPWRLPNGKEVFW